MLIFLYRLDYRWEGELALTAAPKAGASSLLCAEDASLCKDWMLQERWLPCQLLLRIASLSKVCPGDFAMLYIVSE